MTWDCMCDCGGKHCVNGSECGNGENAYMMKQKSLSSFSISEMKEEIERREKINRDHKIDKLQNESRDIRNKILKLEGRLSEIIQELKELI